MNTTKPIMKPINRLFICLMAVGLITACSPTVRVEAPKEPIEINLNVKIEHHIRVQVDKELEGLFEEDSELF